MRKVSFVLIVTVIGVMNVTRFIGLDFSPSGFVWDESSNATHLLCLVQTGADANGQYLPLFSDQFEPEWQRISSAGVVPPTHLYFGALWASLFGYSVISVRAISAFLLTAMTVAVYLLARLFTPRTGALLCALAASISPWAFQLGRLSGMVGFEPVLLVGWTYFFLRSQKIRDAVLAGLFLSLVLYSYPPARVQVPILFLPLLWLRNRYYGFSRAFFAAYLLTGLLVSIPLIYHINSPASRLRVDSVSIFSKDFLEDIGDTSPFIILKIFIGNFFTHFSPDYLFLRGDHNLRHSTQVVGEFSWLDTAALLAGVVVVTARLIGRRLAQDGPESGCRAWRPFLLFCVVGFLAGVVPAALTHEGLPHALRSAGSVPFLVLSTGLILWRVSQASRWTLVAVVGIASLFTVYFLTNYFGSYRVASREAWGADVRDSAERDLRTGNWRRFAAVSRELPEVSLRYFLVEYGAENCLSSEERLAQFRPGRAADGRAVVPKLGSDVRASATELMKNSGFEDRERAGRRAWQPFGKPLLDTSGAQSHSGRNAVQVSTESGYIQSIPITPGGIYVLSHYSRSDAPGSSARLQINWLDRRGKIIDVSMDVIDSTLAWTQQELSATAPGEATTALVFANAQAGSVWLDDYSFILEPQK
jgi:hypothetical protein